MYLKEYLFLFIISFCLTQSAERDKVLDQDFYFFPSKIVSIPNVSLRFCTFIFNEEGSPYKYGINKELHSKNFYRCPVETGQNVLKTDSYFVTLNNVFFPFPEFLPAIGCERGKILSRFRFLKLQFISMNTNK